MWAAAQNQPAMVKLLIEHGAEVDARSVVNDWPRQVTGEPRRMYRPFGGLTPLLFAAREGCLECAQSLVAAGADLDLPDPKGVTALFLAIDNFHFDTAKLLIESGANPNKWDWWGRTPLYSAVDVNTLPHGGRADRRSVDATTSTEIIELLLEAGAWPNVQLKLLPPYRHIGDDRGCDNMLVDGHDAAAARRQDLRCRRDRALARARREFRPAERRRRHARDGGSRRRLGRVRRARLRPRHPALLGARHRGQIDRGADAAARCGRQRSCHAR